jgi:hypothetical protein
MNTKQVRQKVAQIASMGFPRDCWKTYKYMYIVDEELQLIFNFNFGELVHGIRVIFNKVVHLMAA